MISLLLFNHFYPTIDMIILKIEYTIPGKTSSLKFAPFIELIISQKRRQMGYIFI